MALLDKDIFQKEMAIRFCLASGQIPFIEVNAYTSSDLSDRVQPLTDLDVVGLEMLANGTIRRVLYDCKTLRKMSPVNRAFWASGVCKYTNCDHAFVVLSKSSVEEHKISARTLDVSLFTEEEFERFGQTVAMDFNTSKSYLSDVTTWATFENLGTKYDGIRPLISFCREAVPLSDNPQGYFRKLMEVLTRTAGYFDPDKSEHMAVFTSVVASACLLLSPQVVDFRGMFNDSMKKDEYETLLRYYIWGGKESYFLRNKLKTLVDSVKRDEGKVETESHQAFELPHWDGFTKLYRQLIDAPHDLYACALPLKTLAYKQVADASAEKDENLKALVSGNKRFRQFAFGISEYLVVAAKLPKDTIPAFEKAVNEIVE